MIRTARSLRCSNRPTRSRSPTTSPVLRASRTSGTETVDGVETTHYAVTVSTKKLLAGNEQFAGHGPRATMGMPKQIKINAWLNSDQLPVKMIVPFGQMGSFEAHFSEYGEPVECRLRLPSSVSQFGAAASCSGSESADLVAAAPDAVRWSQPKTAGHWLRQLSWSKAPQSGRPAQVILSKAN